MCYPDTKKEGFFVLSAPPPDPRPKRPLPPPKRLRELFEYDPDEGILAWKIHRPRGVKPGDEAGTVTHRGSVLVTVDGRKIAASRIIWAMTHGEYPTRRLQFRDGDAQNLRLNNLVDGPVVDRYENRLLAQGFSPRVAAEMADARAHKTASAILLAEVNKAAMAHIWAEQAVCAEYFASSKLGKKRLIAKFRDMLRARHPDLYPATHLTRGRD